MIPCCLQICFFQLILYTEVLCVCFCRIEKSLCTTIKQSVNHFAHRLSVCLLLSPMIWSLLISREWWIIGQTRITESEASLPILSSSCCWLSLVCHAARWQMSAASIRITSDLHPAPPLRKLSFRPCWRNEWEIDRRIRVRTESEMHLALTSRSIAIEHMRARLSHCM